MRKKNHGKYSWKYPHQKNRILKTKRKISAYKFDYTEIRKITNFQLFTDINPTVAIVDECKHPLSTQFDLLRSNYYLTLVGNSDSIGV